MPNIKHKLAKLDSQSNTILFPHKEADFNQKSSLVDSYAKECRVEIIKNSGCDYTKNANLFLWDNKLKLTLTYLGKSSPSWDNEHLHNHWRFTLSSKNESYSSNYWDSRNNTENGTSPTAYDILAAIGSTVSLDDLGSIQDFQDNYGYDKVSDCIATYEAVKKEVIGLRRVLNQTQLGQLQEIN